MNKLSQYLVDNILNEVEEGITVMLPGGFKPPHEGHFQLAKGYEEMPQVKEVVILIGPKDRDGITVEDSVEIWKMLVSNIPNIRIEKSKYPSPLLSAYKYIENDAKSGQSYALGSSSKGSDYDRIRGFVDQHQEDGKYYKDGVAVVELPLEKSNPLLYRGRTDDENSKPISASQLRADLAANDFENFKTNYPSIKSTSELQTIYDLLTKKKMKEDSQDISQSTLDENKLRDYTQKLKSSFKSFIDKIKQEGQETKEAFIKLTDAVKNGEKLTKQERTEIGDQLKDTLKLAGFGAASVLPGGVIYLLLARLPLLKKTMTPSSFLKEDINLPVNIGDTVLMGRFKNKKVVVNSVSKNEKGDLQINGRPALKFRIPKKEVEEVADYRSRDRYAVDSKEEQEWMSSMVDYLISINKRQHEADPEDITDFVTKNIEYQKDKEKSKEITAYLTWRLVDGESLNEEDVMSKLKKLARKALNVTDFIKVAGEYIGGKVEGQTAKWLTTVYQNAIKTESVNEVQLDQYTVLVWHKGEKSWESEHDMQPAPSFKSISQAKNHANKKHNEDRDYAWAVRDEKNNKNVFVVGNIKEAINEATSIRWKPSAASGSTGYTSKSFPYPTKGDKLIPKTQLAIQWSKKLTAWLGLPINLTSSEEPWNNFFKNDRLDFRFQDQSGVHYRLYQSGESAKSMTYILQKFSKDYVEPRGGTQSSMFENRKPLNEGGAAGHMAHPYEDMDMTFDDIENMIDAALSGKVEYAQEKLDGQNLMITYKDGKVLSARNKGQLKNGAEKAMTKDAMEKSMAHLPDNVKNAFLDAMQDMTVAVDKLTPAEKEEFFENGTKFVNMELLHPDSENVAAYGVTQLRMHNVQEYDMAGNVISTDAKAPQKIQSALDQVEASKQSTYEIRATDLVKLKKTEDYENQKKQLTKDLNQVRGRYGLSKEDKLGLYFQNFWSDFIKNNAKTYSYDIPDDVLQNIINRWAFSSKAINLRQLKKDIDNPQFLQWFADMDKGSGVRDQKKIAAEPVEDVFLKLGVYVLKGLEGLVAINPNDSIMKMKRELARSVELIQTAAKSDNMSDDDASLKFLKAQLKRLDKMGGFDAIVPSEGIVFKHKEKLYKLTGAFAPINQIIGYIKFGR